MVLLADSVEEEEREEEEEGGGVALPENSALPVLLGVGEGEGELDAAGEGEGEPCADCALLPLPVLLPVGGTL